MYHIFIVDTLYNTYTCNTYSLLIHCMIHRHVTQHLLLIHCMIHTHVTQHLLFIHCIIHTHVTQHLLLIHCIIHTHVTQHLLFIFITLIVLSMSGCLDESVEIFDADIGGTYYTVLSCPVLYCTVLCCVRTVSYCTVRTVLFKYRTPYNYCLCDLIYLSIN